MSPFLKYLNRTAAVLFIAALGLLRDFLFVHLNYQLGLLYWHNYEYKLPASLSFLERFDYMQLYYLKYVFTALSFVLFFLGSCWVVYSFFPEKKYLRWVLLSYLIVTLAGGIIFMLMYWVSGFNNTYLFVRKFVDLAESPVLSMVLIISIFLNKKLNPTPTV